MEADFQEGQGIRSDEDKHITKTVSSLLSEVYGNYVDGSAVRGTDDGL